MIVQIASAAASLVVFIISGYQRRMQKKLQMRLVIKFLVIGKRLLKDIRFQKMNRL